MRQGRNLAFCLLAGSLCLTVPAGADWLVTREGGKVETRGPWKVQGKRVIFTLTDGTLSSLRLTEVDLDASQQATAAAEQARQEKETQPPPPPKKSVRVLTDKDFPKPQPAPAAEGAEGEGAAPAAGNTAGKASAAASNAVQVTSWTQGRNTSLNQLEITGMVQNSSPDLATAVSLTVSLFDASGEVISSQEASLTTRTLRPGQNTSFQAIFPGLIGFSSAKLVPNSIPLLTKEPPPAPTSSETPAEEEDEAPPSR